MDYVLEFSERADHDIESFKKSGNKALLVKLSKLLRELMENPIEGTGKPAQLKHHLNGLYSRRINQEHRLVYRIENNIVYILSVRGHYY
jgi:toxin YoeB